ncbi:type I methionyl aminopeptidase [Pseudoduganella lutea]|uniref:Methionine aminopeptidase n=1 Tax=Pseudoduganella lutea TaxID=321985 RepID=A0A4V0Z3P7_9BURK|nr:type I methionyl aminopeptidase [Pseudoduganella lutea]
MGIVNIKTAEQIELSRTAGQLAADVLTMIGPHVRPGVSTAYLDELCHRYIVDVLKVIPANVGYHGYTKTILTSVNDVVCHGIPSPKTILKDGDIVNIDVAVIKDGWFGDTSRMVHVGKPSRAARRLCEVTYEAMWAGIRAVRPGATLGDVGHAIQSLAENAGYSVVRNFCGHGIGTEYHEDLQVRHFGRPGTGLTLQPGMIFTIEPMVNAGHYPTRTLADGWTVVTEDRSLSAQWEHMVAVTPSGFDVLTLAPGEHAA